ncbi:MAG: sodium:calcium antiporter [Spirochaetota bacterium]
MPVGRIVLLLLLGLPLAVLVPVIAVSIYVLSAGADVLVTQAVSLSRRFNVSPVIIGATIVSLGTTTPETAVSVLSAIDGDPGLAMGNAVGSIIANTALIIGIAALIRPIPVDRTLIRRQGLVQYGSSILLVVGSLPVLTGAATSPFVDGGRLPQWVGLLFVGLLGLYLVVSIRWSRNHPHGVAGADDEIAEVPIPESSAETVLTVLKLLLGFVLVVAASQILIPAVEATALRLGVPRAVVAASLVAIGTSLPELVTAITASRKGHSELALGNVVGANILNALFVVGLSASVTRGGLAVSADFFSLFYPAMLVAGALLYLCASLGKLRIGRAVGTGLIVLYVGFIVLSYAA